MALDIEIEGMEKEYMVKIAKLLLMAQAHCEIKTDINYMFDEMGLLEPEEDEEQIEEAQDQKVKDHIKNQVKQSNHSKYEEIQEA